MGMRFRKRMKLAPGVHVSLSKSGLGLGVGPRGAKVGVGPRGGYWSVGVPGTGVHYRKEAIYPSKKTGGGGSGPPGSQPGQAQVVLKDDGTVQFLDHTGAPLPPRLVKMAREQNAEGIAQLLRDGCEKLNEGIDGILGIHLGTPAPQEALTFRPLPFELEKPQAPVPRSLGLRGRLFRSRREAIEKENALARDNWRGEVEAWEGLRTEHEKGQAARREYFEAAQTGHVPAMEILLGESLHALEWPSETMVSFQVGDEGDSVWLDVDLPEVEDMPRKSAKVAARGVRLLVKERSETQIRKDYMVHIHGVVFRLVGEAFLTLPTVREVTASAYSQRPDPSTGQIDDEYLLSVRVDRRSWSEINFQNLEALEVVASFDRFELRRRMTRTGIFKPIEPLVTGAVE